MKAIFTYKGTFDNPDGSNPGYTTHNGPVEVTASLHPSEYSREDVGPMYKIRAGDGWTGEAFADELQHIG